MAASSAQFERGHGRRYCQRCNLCFDAKNAMQDLCPSCRKLDAAEEQQREAERTRVNNGLQPNAFYTVKADGRDWQLPLLDIAETIRMGYFPLDVPVEWRGRMGYIRLTARGAMWRPIETGGL